MKIKFKYISIILCIFVFTACNKQPRVEQKPVVQETPQKELYLNILTTNKLLYYMVKDVVGEKHYVDYMFTSNNKLWNFSFTDDSINNISRKDMFFYWGSGLEPWMPVFVDKLGTKRVAPVSISRGIKFIEYGRQPKYKETNIVDNPYFWVNIDDYKVSMLNIKNSLQDKDSKNRDFYEKNFTKALKEVEDYQKKIKEAAEKLKDYTFVVDGDEMEYFIKYYGFKSIKIYNYGVMTTPKIEEDNLKAEAKFKEAKNLIFLYDSDQKLKANESLISKYNLKSVGIMVQKDDIRYLDILYNNLRSLESLTITQ